MSDDRPMKELIVQAILDTALGIREGVGKLRSIEYAGYIDQLIKAKDANLDASLLQMPMLTERTSQEFEATLAMQNKVGAAGGIEWNFLALKGEYGSTKEEGLRILMKMDFMSPGIPNFAKLQASSVEDLKALRGQDNKVIDIITE